MSETNTQSVEQARELIERAAAAQKILATFSQEKVDAIVGVMARAALEDSYRLGEMAHLEPDMVAPPIRTSKIASLPNRFTISSNRCERWVF